MEQSECLPLNSCPCKNKAVQQRSSNFN